MSYNENQILDEQFQENPSTNPENYIVSAGTRFANNIVDGIIVTVIYYVFTIFGGLNTETYFLGSILLNWGFIFAYYFIFETAFQKTPAKFLTKTIVVSEFGVKPTPSAILVRTLCRLIPFEAFSFLGKIPIGWHDSLSKTLVISDQAYQEHFQGG